MDKGGNRAERRLVAKFSSGSTPEDSTDFYIGNMDKEKIKKLVEFLQEINLKPSLYNGSSENETVVSVDISSERKFNAYERILLFMNSLEERKEENISSVISRSDSERERGYDLDMSTTVETVYTLANSSDILNIAKRLSAGEQSDFELIVSKPYDKRALLQKSKNIINYIQRSEDNVRSNISCRRKRTSKFFKDLSVKTLRQIGTSVPNKKEVLVNVYRRFKRSKFFSGIVDICSLRALRKGLGRRNTTKTSHDRGCHRSVSRIKDISHRRFKKIRNAVVSNNRRDDGVLTLEAYTQTGADVKRDSYKSKHSASKYSSIRRSAGKCRHTSTCTNALSYSCSTKVQSTSDNNCTCTLAERVEVCPKVCFVNNLNDYNIAKVQNGNLVFFPINVVPRQTCFREQYQHAGANIIGRISNREVRESTTVFSVRNSDGTENTSFLTKKQNLIEKKWVRVKRRKATNMRLKTKKNCNSHNKSNSERFRRERKNSELISKEYSSSFLLRETVHVARKEPNPERLIVEQFYKEQLQMLNEKLDNITGLQKQLVDVSTGCFSTPLFQSVIAERVDVGVTCVAKADVAIECVGKANAQLECNIIEKGSVGKRNVIRRPRIANHAYSANSFRLRSEHIKFPLYTFPKLKTRNASSPHLKCAYRSKVFSNYPADNLGIETGSSGLFIKSCAILKKLKTIFRVGVSDTTKELSRDAEELMQLRTLLRNTTTGVQSSHSFDNEDTDDENFRFWLSRTNTGDKSLTCRVEVNGGRKELSKLTEKSFLLRNNTGETSRGIRSNQSLESEDTDEEDYQFWMSRTNTGKKAVSFRKPLID